MCIYLKQRSGLKDFILVDNKNKLEYNILTIERKYVDVNERHWSCRYEIIS